MNNILRFTIVLCVVNLVAASILAGVYQGTKPRIEAQEVLVKEQALKEVMPESVGDRIEAVEEGYWKVYRGASDRVRGYIFIARKYGYSSVIETMVGMKQDGTITGVAVLSQNETPGLGAKIAEITSDKTIAKAVKGVFSKEKVPEEKTSPYFTEQFKGRSVKTIDISNIDAITGATISSKAVVDSIKEEGLKVLNK